MYTYQKLLDYHRQNQDLKGTVIGEYNASQIAGFNRYNRQTIETVVSGLNDLQQKYFVHDEKGVLQFDGEGKDRKPRSQEGRDPKDYSRVRNEFLQTKCAIRFK